MLLPPRLNALPLRWPARSRRAVLAIFAVLGGCGAVAFAVAPLTAQAPLPPLRLVTEVLRTPVQAAELQAWRDQSLALHRTEITRAGDSLAAVLRRLDVNDPEAAQALAQLAAGPEDKGLQQALAGDRHWVQALTTADGGLQALTVRTPATDPSQAHTHYRQFSVQRVSGGWSVAVVVRPLVARPQLAGGRIQTELRASVADPALPRPVAAQLLVLCADQPDGECALGRGDSYAALYDTLTAEGETVPWNDGVGRVQALRFVARGVARQLTWFVGPDGKGGYFDGRGRGREPGFRSSPLAVSQITSGFATRVDPILHRPMDHKGVDYAAPIGTPVHSVATGVVEFAGRQSGYGNVVEVRHGGQRSTLYAHLSRIDVAEGDKVESGRVLGAVGSTGWATGPHLHFEYRVAGVHQDPQLAADTAEQLMLSPTVRTQLQRSSQVARAALDRAVLLATERTRFE